MEYVLIRKKHNPLIRCDDLCTLDYCLVIKIQPQSEKSFLTCVCYSTSQSQEELEIFCTNLNILLSQINDDYPLCPIVTRDFNARCTKDDITKFNRSRNIFSHIITRIYTNIGKPTNATNTSISYICLIFVNYGKTDIRVPLPSKYVGEVWKYS